MAEKPRGCQELRPKTSRTPNKDQVVWDDLISSTFEILFIFDVLSACLSLRIDSKFDVTLVPTVIAQTNLDAIYLVYVGPLEYLSMLTFWYQCSLVSNESTSPHEESNLPPILYGENAYNEIKI